MTNDYRPAQFFERFTMAGERAEHTPRCGC